MASGIEQWLADLDLSQYADAFLSNAVNLEILPDLDEDDLEKLGVGALGHQKYCYGPILLKKSFFRVGGKIPAS